MSNEILSVRELREDDIPFIIRYWLESDPAFLTGMGVDLSKLPSKEEWEQMLREQTRQSIEQKKSYCIIWLLDDEPVGHCNVNKIEFGNEAYMHLHLWPAGKRKKGIGTEFVKKSLPYFFRNLSLQKLYCEPYAFNPAPNKTLERIGFTFIEEYITTPGWINFEQPVKRWQLNREDFEQLNRRD